MVGYSACMVHHAIKVLVVEGDDHPVAGEVHIGFEVAEAKLDCMEEGGGCILRSSSSATSMSDPERCLRRKEPYTHGKRR